MTEWCARLAFGLDKTKHSFAVKILCIGLFLDWPSRDWQNEVKTPEASLLVYHQKISWKYAQIFTESCLDICTSITHLACPSPAWRHPWCRADPWLAPVYLVGTSPPWAGPSYILPMYTDNKHTHTHNQSISLCWYAARQIWQGCVSSLRWFSVWLAQC